MSGYEQNATIVMNAIPGVMTGITTLISGFASINQQFQNITNGISDGFGFVDAAIISTSALVVKLGWDAAQAYGQFEQGMRIVQVVSNQGASAMEELSVAANQFSVQYRTDIDKITEGLQVLGRAGLNNAHEQTQVLQNGLQTAKLEGRELNTVLEEILQNTSLLGGDIRSSEFGEQSTYVNDLLVSTSMTAPITSHDISQTLQYSGGLAATAGANIQSEENKEILTDYMATIAAFAQKGVKGSLAGTALRAFLNKPATQDSSVQEGLAMIKLKPEYLWEEDEETMKPISEQIALIKGQMDKLNVSQMDRLQIWSKIVGGKMGQQMMKLEPEDIQKLTSEIDKATSSEEMANKSMNTFSQNLKKTEEQGQVVFRNIGEHVVKILNPILMVADKILELFSNPIVSFGLFAGGLALVVEGAKRLWVVVKAVKDEFMLMRAMATEAFQAIAAQSTASAGAISSLGNIMIGGKAGGLTAETNKINVLNQGLITTKGLIADIQMQALNVAGGAKLLPGHKYNQGVAGSVVGQETRTIERMSGEEAETVNQLRQFHVFDTKNAKELAKVNKMINDVGLQRYNEYKDSTSKPEPLKDEAYFRAKAALDVRMIGPDKKYAYIMGPWQDYKAEQQTFNEQEKYAHAMAFARSGEKAVPLDSEEAKQMEEARAAAEKEVARRKSLGFRGRLKEDIGNRLAQFEEEGRSMLRLDAFPKTLQNAGNFLKGIKTSILDTKLPFQGTGVDAFQDFRKSKMRYLTRADLNHLIDSGHLPSSWKDSTLSTREMNKAARQYWKAQDNPYARTNALGQLYNDVYKTERTIRTTLSSLRRGLGNLTNLPTILSNFRNRLSSSLLRMNLENISANFQNRLRQGFTGLGNTIRGIISGLQRTRNFIINAPRENILGGKFQKVLETGFIGLGDSVRALSGNIRTGVSSTKESLIQLSTSATEAAAKLRNLNASTIKDKIGNGLSGVKSSISSGFYTGAGAIGAGVSKVLGGVAKGASMTVGALSTFSSYLGGPVMIAIMAFSSIMSFINKKMQEYAEEVNEAKSQLKDAYSDRSSAESKLKAAYREQNPDATDEEIGAMTLNAYSNMREEMKDQNKWLEKISVDIKDPKRYAYDEEKDDGSMKEVKEELTDEESLQKAIDENTSAIYTATAEISVALDKYVSKMDDGIWGIDGLFSKFSDKLGYLTDTWGGLSEGSSYTSSGGFLKTATQKDSNYQGYTEFPGLFLEDAFDTNGSLQLTVERLFGTDADEYMGALNSDTKGFLQEMSKSAREMGRAANSRLQASMMNDKKTWQMGAKELAKYEVKNKKPVGAQETKNTRLENIIKKLQIDTGLSRIQVLQGMYLQQMQDMYTIAEQAMVPLIAQNATAAANTLMLGQQEFPYNQGTTKYTSGTMQVAQAISAQLSVIAWAKAGEATRNAALADPDNELHQLAMDTKDGDEFMKEAIKREEGTDFGGLIRPIGQAGEAVLDFNMGDNSVIKLATGKDTLAEALTGKKTIEEYYAETGGTPLSKQRILIGGGDIAAMDQILDTFGATTYTTLGMSLDDAIKEAQEDRRHLRESGENYHGVYEYFAKMWGSPQMGEQLVNPYLASGIGEEDSGSGSGGSGSGDGDKDKNQGTRKERVDLVLCNKKEIPKLNVNLFKKPPTFTVLNKNFKLRDVKINTEDKPKAIMASIKNAFIDVQKRSDPKIIQDEEAEYDPVAATDGNSVPSGSSRTGTNQ